MRCMAESKRLENLGVERLSLSITFELTEKSVGVQDPYCCPETTAPNNSTTTKAPRRARRQPAVICQRNSSYQHLSKHWMFNWTPTTNPLISLDRSEERRV